MVPFCFPGASLVPRKLNPFLPHWYSKWSFPASLLAPCPIDPFLRPWCLASSPMNPFLPAREALKATLCYEGPWLARCPRTSASAQPGHSYPRVVKGSAGLPGKTPLRQLAGLKLGSTKGDQVALYCLGFSRRFPLVLLENVAFFYYKMLNSNQKNVEFQDSIFQNSTFFYLIFFKHSNRRMLILKIVFLEFNIFLF